MDIFPPVRLKSLSDLQSIIESMENKPVPKLDESTISMLNEALDMFEQNNQGEIMVTGLQFVIAVINRALKSFSYSADDWDLIATDVIMLFRRILKWIIFNHVFLKTDENTMRVITSGTEVLLNIGGSTTKLQSLLVEHNGIQVLQLICWEDLAFYVRKRILYCFKMFLVNLSTVQRRALADKTDFLKCSLVTMLPSCGDIEFQEYLIELLVRFAMTQRGWKRLLKSWFSGFPSVAECIEMLDSKHFEFSCRKFLNLVNGMQSPDIRVHSIQCVHAVVSNRIVLKRPPSYDELWLDCSPRTSNIQLLIDGDDSQSLVRVTVDFSSVQSIKCYRESDCTDTEEECCQLIINVHPPIEIPFKTEVSFSELLVVVRKNLKFLQFENNFLKVIYANCYEPERSLALPKKTQHLENVSLISSRSIENDSCASTPLINSSFRHKTTSTPLKNEDTDLSVREVGLGVLRKCMKKANQKGDEAMDIVSINSGYRTSISEPITHLAHTNLGEDQERFQSEVSAYTTFMSAEDTQCNSNESNNYSHKGKAMCYNSSHSTENILSKVLVASESIQDPILINDTVTSQQNVFPLDTVGDNVANIVHLTTPSSNEAELREHRGSIVNNSIFVSIQPQQQQLNTTSTCHQVFGNNVSLVDFNALISPSPTVTPTQLPTKKKFFGAFRQPNTEVSESEVSNSSCSTRLSRRQCRGFTRISSPSLKLSACTPKKPPIAPDDPYSFKEDEKLGNCMRGGAGVKHNTQTPSSIKRQKRKLYTPGRDDLVHSDHRDSSSPIKTKRSLKAKKKCILDPCGGESLSETDPGQDKFQNVPENENFRRRSSRLKKKVNYKDTSSNENGHKIGKTCVSSKHLIGSSSKVEPLRSERKASSPPMPLGSPPITVNLDPGTLSPPHYLESAHEPEPVESSPPLRVMSPVHQDFIQTRRNEKNADKSIDHVVKRRRNKKQPNINSTDVPSAALSNEVLINEDNKKQVIECLVQSEKNTSLAIAGMDDMRQQAVGDMKPHDNDNQGILSSSMCVDTAGKSTPLAEKTREFEDIRLCHRTTPSQANQRACPNSNIPVQNEVKSICLKAPFTPTYSSQDQLENGVVSLRSKTSVKDRIWSEIKTYINGVNRENERFMESVKVNLNTCLTTHENLMNTIQEETLNIDRSAANIQSARERSIANLNVVRSMLNVIEEVHGRSAVAASVQNNDPRTYSQLRQRIYKIIDEASSPNPNEK